MSKEVLKQALEALEEFLTGDLREVKAGATITALRQALEQPAPPVIPKNVKQSEAMWRDEFFD